MSKRVSDLKVGDEYWHKGVHLGTITSVSTKYSFTFRDKNGNTNSTREYHAMERVEIPPAKKCGDVTAGDTIDCCGIWRIVNEKRAIEDGCVEFVFADNTPPRRVTYKAEDVVRISS